MTATVDSRRNGRADSSILAAALRYHALGFCVIPVKPGTKIPACRWKQFQEHRPTESDLRNWFGDPNSHGLAVVLGDVSGGLVCRDFDEQAAYGRWRKKHLVLARTLPTVETHRGWHVYCRSDICQIIDLGDGELRGAGVCVLPPTVHPDGGRYRWQIDINGEIPRVELSESGFLPKMPPPSPLLCPELSELSESSGASVLQDLTAGAIDRTLPCGPRQRHRRLFDLARELRGIPALADASLGELKPIIREWHARALPFIRTQPFEESWFDFVEGWSKVKYATGKGPIEKAFAAAVEADVPAVAMQYEQPALRLLVGLCQELQRIAGAEPFYLASRTAGRLLNVNHTCAWRWLRGLCADRVLELVQSGTRIERQANEYRYVASPDN